MMQILGKQHFSLLRECSVGEKMMINEILLAERDHCCISHKLVDVRGHVKIWRIISDEINDAHQIAFYHRLDLIVSLTNLPRWECGLFNYGR